jgi:hypothetical protein
MALADAIGELANRTLVALDGGHDYYTYTKRVWRLLQRIVKEGRTFNFRNPATGTAVDQQALLLRRAQGLPRHPRAQPGIANWKQVDFGTVLKATDKTAIISGVVDRELNELKYERVADWFAYLDRLVKLGCPTADEIEQLAEIKASRDILVHNRGIANATYLAKAGSHSRCRDGERLEIPEPYHRASWETIKKVIQDVSQAAIQKAGPSGP